MQEALRNSCTFIWNNCASLCVMPFTLAPETIQLIELGAYALGLSLAVIVVAAGLAEIGAFFIGTRM